MSLPTQPGKNTQEENKDTIAQKPGKRYNLTIPTPLLEEVQTLAAERNTSVLDLLKQLIKIGLIVIKLSQSPDTAIIVREGGREREVLFI